MIEMRMVQQHMTEPAKPGAGAQDLALRALAAIDQKPLSAGADQQGRQAAFGRWRARCGAEEGQLEHRTMIATRFPTPYIASPSSKRKALNDRTRLAALGAAVAGDCADRADLCP